METRAILFFLQEVMMMERRKRQGWDWFANMPDENVASHTALAAIIGFILAKMEGYDNPAEVVMLCVFHDLAEVRGGDQDYIMQRYGQQDELAAVEGMTEDLGEVGKEVVQMWKAVEDKATTAAKIAKDADYLQCALRANTQRGSSQMSEYFCQKLKSSFRTQAAHALWGEMTNRKPEDWAVALRMKLMGL